MYMYIQCSSTGGWLLSLIEKGSRCWKFVCWHLHCTCTCTCLQAGSSMLVMASCCVLFSSDPLSSSRHFLSADGLSMVGREPSDIGKMVSRLRRSTAKCIARMSTRLLPTKRIEQWFWLTALCLFGYGCVCVCVCVECVREKRERERVSEWEREKERERERERSCECSYMYMYTVKFS